MRITIENQRVLKMKHANCVDRKIKLALSRPVRTSQLIITLWDEDIKVRDKP